MLSSFISGVLATLTPCTIVIIPLFLYRFGIWGDKTKKLLAKDLFLTLTSFFASLLLVAILFENLSNSGFNSLIRLLLGTIFIILGVLQIFKKLSINLMKNITNPIAFGFLIPWTLGFSPCVLPIFATFLSSSLGAVSFVLEIILFGLGLITPAILLALFGNQLMKLFSKTEKIMVWVEKFSGLILLASGIYLNFQILHVRAIDMTLGGIFFISILLIGGYLVFVKRRQINLANISMFFSVLLMTIIFLTNCHSLASESERQEVNHACGIHKESCELCDRCSILFSIAGVIGGIGYVLSQITPSKRVKFTLEDSEENI